MASKLVTTMDEDALWNRWGENVATIADEWIYFLQNRTRYRAMQRLLARSMPHGGRTDQTRGFLEILWSTEAVMTVRRELDDQAGVTNIRHLLHELEQRPEVVTRERFMDWARISLNFGFCTCCWRDERAQATSWFESFSLVIAENEEGWDYSDRDHLDPIGVAAERRSMELACSEVFQYAQRLVAHRTPMKHHWINIKELDTTIDTIWRVIQRYYLLLNGEQLTPKRPRPKSDWNKDLKEILEYAAVARDDS